MLAIVVQFGFRTLPSTFSKAPVIHHKKIVAVAYKIHGKLSPALDTPRITFEIINNASTVRNFEMDAIDTASIFHVKGTLLKIKGIGKGKVVRQYFGPEEEVML